MIKYLISILMFMMLMVQPVSADLTKGLVGHWFLNETSADATYEFKDSTPYENHGTKNGNPTVGATYTTFDGNADSIDLGLTYDYTDNFSIAAWIKTSTDNVRIFTKRDSTEGIQYDFHVAITTGVMAVYDGAGSYIASKDVTDNVWHCVVMVINGASSQFYVDGVADGSAFDPTISSSSTTKAIIGAMYNTGDAGEFVGDMADVRFYNRVLAQNEITELYQMGRPKDKTAQPN